jgi:hypothetical protein
VRQASVSPCTVAIGHSTALNLAGNEMENRSVADHGPVQRAPKRRAGRSASGTFKSVASLVLPKNPKLWTGVALAAVTLALGGAYAQQGPRGKSSYAPVEITEPFSAIFAQLSAQKPDVTREHMALLNERYDLSNRAAAGVTMDRTKPAQEGVRVKLPAGKTWEALANMSPEQIRDQNVFPKGFYPLPHPKHPEGGFVFPRFLIDAIKREEERDLTRFDVDYDIPDHFLQLIALEFRRPEWLERMQLSPS